MNILVLMKDSQIGGVTSCVKSLIEGLENYNDVKVVVGSCDGEGIEKFFNDKKYNVSIINFDRKNPISVIGNYFKIKKIIKEENIDIIHAQNRIPAIYAAVVCFLNKKIKYIWSNHLVPIPSDIIHRLSTFYGECAVAEGIEGRKMLIDDFHIDPSKVEVVNLGVDFSSFKPISDEDQIIIKEKNHISKDDKVILLYGRLAPVKGHLFLLEAMKNMNSNNFKIVFPGEGEGYKQDIINLAKKYGLNDHIVFPGYIKGNEWLSIADLMVLPSKKEGFGIVNVEAFSMGVPVIRTTTAGYEDMKDLCFGVDYGNVKDLEELLLRFFEDDIIFKQKREYAKKHCDRFSQEMYAKRYYTIYKKVLNYEEGI